MKRVTAQIINPLTSIKQELSICEPVKEGSEIDNVLLRFGISLSVLDIISDKQVTVPGLTDVRIISGIVKEGSTIVTVVVYDC